jgi:hypothetical protein
MEALLGLLIFGIVWGLLWAGVAYYFKKREEDLRQRRLLFLELMPFYSRALMKGVEKHGAGIWIDAPKKDDTPENLRAMP